MNKLLLFIMVCLCACSPRGPHKPVGDGQVQPATVGYDNVRAIFANSCSACHPSRSGPDWLDFSQAQVYARNGKLFQRVVQEKSMPPVGSAQAASITDSQRRTLGAWARAGGPMRAGQPQAESPGTNVAETESDRLARQCLHCHGTVTEGPSPQTKFPRLAGQNEDYLAGEMLRFKWRERIDPSQSMNDIAGDLSDDQIRQVARYYASGKPGGLATEGARVGPENQALYEYGKARAATECISCHANPERNGLPLNPRFPLISGQSKRYLVNQLMYFRSRERPGGIMLEMAKGLSNRDIEALALYFSSL